ncbi:MAG: lipocalin-like domain-containing protein [Thermomicrobiales bacterium]
MVRQSWACLTISAVILLMVVGTGADSFAASEAVRSPGSGSPVDAPVPVELPADDRVHDELIEWWYFTGHLETPDGSTYGFQYVFFRASTGALTAFVSHVAITDHQLQRFSYDQRLEPGDATVDGSPGQLALRIGDWSVTIDDGIARLQAAFDDYAFDLLLTPEKAPALHNVDGYVQYDDDTWSYYYSRTRIDVLGELTSSGETSPVTGVAWFDHQWGSIDTFRDGGWDWFSIQLDDQTEIMAYVLYSADREIERVDVTIVDRDGTTSWLREEDFSAVVLDSWTSPATDITWPSGWEITIPSRELILTVTPVILDQELNTLATTGVIYWEGAVHVKGLSAGEEVTGVGYVELTGYAVST